MVHALDEIRYICHYTKSGSWGHGKVKITLSNTCYVRVLYKLTSNLQCIYNYESF